MKTERLDACACMILAYKNYGLIPYNDISDKRGQGQISAKRARPLRISVYMKYIYMDIYMDLIWIWRFILLATWSVGCAVYCPSLGQGLLLQLFLMAFWCTYSQANSPSVDQ